MKHLRFTYSPKWSLSPGLNILLDGVGITKDEFILARQRACSSIGGDPLLSQTATLGQNNNTAGFAERLEDEFAAVRLAPRFSTVLNAFFELEADLAAIDQVLLHPPKSHRDRSIYSITKVKFRAETSVRETARAVVKCEKRLDVLCELFNVGRAHCGVTRELTDKQFNDTFLNEEKGRALWRLWVDRKHIGTLDSIDPGRPQSWYFVANFSSEDALAKSQGEKGWKKYFVGQPKAVHLPHWYLFPVLVSMVSLYV